MNHPSSNFNYSWDKAGTGIPEDVQGKIFDTFFTTKGIGKGTGLGLFVVKKEVERHMGKLSFESKMGVGTTFTIEFPFSRESIA